MPNKHPPLSSSPTTATTTQRAQVQPQKQTTLFVGSISGGITDATLLNNVEVPALEDGCANKKLLIKADEKPCALDAYASTRPLDPGAAQTSKAAIDTLVADINRVTADELAEGKRDFPVPRARDEVGAGEDARAAGADPDTRGSAKRAEDEGVGATEEVEPKREREREEQQPPREQGMGKGAQGYNKPVVFVREREGGREPKRQTQTDEELEAERKEGRRRNEECKRREEPRERTRILILERAIARQRQAAESDARSGVQLEAWDDDESDELFYIDCARWRAVRARHLATEQSVVFEQEEAANLARESEDFLARQMGEMQALAEEQLCAGLLLPCPHLTEQRKAASLIEPLRSRAWETLLAVVAGVIKR
ncbi:hypothetical protein B0H14DRAFT_3658507 [Mycena olivaceomarginata]|nr:hypothetical protein B0H14DRAFT_3658507 [Mycena olivaceomarginata]